MQLLSDLFQQPCNVLQLCANTIMEWSLEGSTLCDNPLCVHYILSLKDGIRVRLILLCKEKG